MSLDGAYDDDNVFAKILRDEIPSFRVHEDDDVLAFMDVFPQARGHVLVILKNSRARNLLEASEAELATLIGATRKVALAVRRALNPDGVTIKQFNGATAGQTVFHLHFHVVPRYANEPLIGHGQAGMADGGELAALAAAIEAEMG